jgi:hypothetical protein
MAQKNLPPEANPSECICSLAEQVALALWVASEHVELAELLAREGRGAC